MGIAKESASFQKFVAAAGIVCSLFSALSAHANRGGHRPLPVEPPLYGPGFQNEVTIDMNQYFSGFSSVDVDSMVAHAAQGRPIESVSVRMASNSGRAQVSLLNNGAPVDRTVVVSTAYLSDYFFSVGGSYAGYGSRLRLQMNGDVFLQSFTARFAAPGYPNPGRPPRPYPRPPRPAPQPPHSDRQVATQYLNQYLVGSNYLQLDQILSLYRFHGYRVERVTLRARTDAGRGRAALMVNGQIEGQPAAVGTWTQDHVFYPASRMQVGRDLRDIAIHLQGRFTVESVSVELTNSRY
jgi:hypothetical protein